jgi:hypothetical protein
MTEHRPASESESRWSVPTAYDSVFAWRYAEQRPKLERLYRKGKQRQWDGEVRIDWSIDVDPRSAALVPDEYVMIYGSPWWHRMSAPERDEVRHHMHAWTISQFLHGEQGALLCAAKLIQAVPDADSKFYAATQAMDEARHVEVFERYLRTKLEMTYPINRELRQLLEQVVGDRRWDMTYLGMQILIEGLALAAFGINRDFLTEPLMVAINAYVMEDEARHVAFGVKALEDVYGQMTEAERREREEFVIEACHLMRDRFMAQEVWDTLGLPGCEVVAWVDENGHLMREYRKMLFSRIVPNIKRIGLWGPRVVQAFTDLEVIDYQDLEPEAFFRQDEEAARRLDELRAEGWKPAEVLERLRSGGPAPAAERA